LTLTTVVPVQSKHLAASGAGLIYTQQGKPDEAIQSSQKAIELAPNNAVSHYQLGVALKRQGRFKEALAALRQASDWARAPG
jgi:superkiller protein 3